MVVTSNNDKNRYHTDVRQLLLLLLYIEGSLVTIHFVRTSSDTSIPTRNMCMLCLNRIVNLFIIVVVIKSEIRCVV